MQARLQKRKSHGKYFTYYIDLPKEAVRQLKWLKKQRIIELEIDLLHRLVITPGDR